MRQTSAPHRACLGNLFPITTNRALFTAMFCYVLLCFVMFCYVLLCFEAGPEGGKNTHADHRPSTEALVQKARLGVERGSRLGDPCPICDVLHLPRYSQKTSKILLRPFFPSLESKKKKIFVRPTLQARARSRTKTRSMGGGGEALVVVAPSITEQSRGGSVGGRYQPKAARIVRQKQEDPNCMCTRRPVTRLRPP